MDDNDQIMWLMYPGKINIATIAHTHDAPPRLLEPHTWLTAADSTIRILLFTVEGIADPRRATQGITITNVHSREDIVGLLRGDPVELCWEVMWITAIVRQFSTTAAAITIACDAVAWLRARQVTAHVQCIAGLLDPMWYALLRSPAACCSANITRREFQWTPNRHKHMQCTEFRRQTIQLLLAVQRLGTLPEELVQHIITIMFCDLDGAAQDS